jgi:hypothetical protein
MDEHMKMMKDLMTQMQAAKLKPGMTAQEANEWIAEHMKLMDGMMDQMMKEHHMMMMQH